MVLDLIAFLMKYLSVGPGPMDTYVLWKFVNQNLALTHACFADLLCLISPTFQVRQITVTVRYNSWLFTFHSKLLDSNTHQFWIFSLAICRTIINGICYLATFVFGLNSVGLFLYSGQLALNSFSEDSGNSDVKNKDELESRSLNMSSENSSTEENNDTDQTSWYMLS